MCLNQKIYQIMNNKTTKLLRRAIALSYSGEDYEKRYKKAKREWLTFSDKEKTIHRLALQKLIDSESKKDIIEETKSETTTD